MESTSCLLVLKPSLYNYSPIHNHYFSSGEQPSFALLQSRPGKPLLSTHQLSAHLRSRPGKAPTFRAPPSRPKSAPSSATWFREPLYKPAWPRETPYTTIDVFHLSWAAARNKIDNSQGAYQKDKSTIDHIFTLMAIVQKYLSKAGGRFYCAFIDLQLWYRLINEGMHGRVLKVLRSMYGKLKSRVKTANGLTILF